MNLFLSDKVLEITGGIDNLGGLNPHLSICLVVAWTCVFLALLKGVASLGKMSYFTATFPYIILTILVVKGALLDGAEYGIEFYVGKFEVAKLAEPQLWMDAVNLDLIFIHYSQIRNITKFLYYHSAFKSFMRFQRVQVD